MYIALAGGVGGARLAYGLSRVLPPSELLVTVNTGDDFEHLGLSISPDLDTVCYTLAELEDQERGWGRADETWRFMQTLADLGQPGWFLLGDADLALHTLRTQMKSMGQSLGSITESFRRALGIGCRVVPMTDDRMETMVHSVEGVLTFQDYFVRQQCKPVATGFEYRGIANARPHAELLAGLHAPELQATIICPSNPWLSIEPILSLPGVRAALKERTAPVAVVSPIVGGKAIKGPAGKLMAELGLEVSAFAIAQHYAGIADVIVIDNADSALRPAIERLGLRAFVTNTVMGSREDRIRLAAEVLQKGLV